jgi:sugar/nucleoside kinase (ribokinase family)
MAKLLVVGDLGWDLLPHSRQLGGWATTFAHYANLLGHDVALASSLGKDIAADGIAEELLRIGLDTSLIQVDSDIATQVVSVSFRDDGTPIYEPSGKCACEFITKTPALIAAALKTDVIYYNARGLRLSGTRMCISDLCELTPHACRVFDSRGTSLVREYSHIHQSLLNARVVYVSFDEITHLCRLIGLPELEPALLCSALVERFPVDVCLVGAAGLGVYASSRQSQEAYHATQLNASAFRVGWHESFLAGFITCYYHTMDHTMDLETCCALGIRYAEVLATRTGSLSRWSRADISAIFDKD